VADDEARAQAAPAPKRSIIPRIVVNDVAGCASFLKSTFGAEGEVFVERPTELVIGDSIVMISSLGERDHFPAFLYIYVDDVDATYQRAVHAGAEIIETPSDQFYGDRRAMVKDSYGNVYQVATPVAPNHDQDR
jgi:PhnB protein